MSAQHRGQGRVPVRRLAATTVAGLALGLTAVAVAELAAGPDVQTVEVTPAQSGATPQPSLYRPAAACRCPVRVHVDGVLVPAPAETVRVCALSSAACATQLSGAVVDGSQVRR